MHACVRTSFFASGSSAAAVLMADSSRGRRSSRSDVAARASSRERCGSSAPATDAFQSSLTNGIDTRGKPLALSISHPQNITTYHETQNFKAVHLACEDHELFDHNSAGVDPCGCHPPSFTSEVASTPSPSMCFPNIPLHENQRAGISSQIPGFLFSSKKLCFEEADSSKPMVLKALDSGTRHQKTASFNKARKVRKTPYKKAGDKSPVMGVPATDDLSMHLVYSSFTSLSKDMVNDPVESKDAMKRRAPRSSLECFKRRHIKSKPLQLAKEFVSKSDLSGVHKSCCDIDLDDNALFDSPKLDVSGELDVMCDNQEHPTGGTSDASRRGFGMDCDGIRAEEMDEEKFGLSGQWTLFLAWFAGLIIRALRFQLKSMFGLFISLLLAWYHSFTFALNPISYMLQAKVRATEAHRKEYTDIVTLGPKIKDRVLSVQPTFGTGARRVALGCLAALYTIIMLTSLFVASLTISFFFVKGFVYEPVQLYKYLYFDYTKPLPAASVNFASFKMHPDTGSIIKRIARPTRKFRATVFLTVPESEFNKELGIFQVTAELLSVTGQVLLSRTQPCMLRFKSTALQRAMSLLMAIPLLTGFSSETQTLAVSSLEWQEQRAFSFAAVRVVLAPRAGRALLTGLPELYEAGLSVKSELRWWVSIVGHWRWTISVWIGLALFFGVVVLVLCLCNQFLLPDLLRVLSTVSDGLVHAVFCKVKPVCRKCESLITEPAPEAMPLGSEHADS